MLSHNESEVMEVLWKENRPLSRGEIIELSTNKSWKPSTIHLLLNSLLKKGAIKVEGFKQTGKNYGRTFSAAITRTDWCVLELSETLPRKPENRQLYLDEVISALFEMYHPIDKVSLAQMQRVLDKTRHLPDKSTEEMANQPFA